ncbi:MAG: ABC transporter ATP-binding protein [Acidimicrobiia bacterium]|nr:ABC transporter ATP-binding protein [Acidimicrobiia bacterium]
MAQLGADVVGPGSVVSLRDVSKRYEVGETIVTALETFDLDVAAGTFVVILGPSGSGKTTLLNLIGALDTVTDGTVRLSGRDVSNASRPERAAVRRGTVSFIFQTFNLFPGLTALENVEFGADVAKRADATTRARAALDEVGLGARLDHFPHQLSGGEQQRVAVARALASGNPVLLADEPTGELDVATGKQILELLVAYAGEGTTVLVVTHNREIARIADRVIELSSGRIVSDGAPVGGPVAVADLQW